MFFVILTTLLLATTPQQDSAFTNICQEQFIDSTTIEVFQTLHSAYLAVEEFKNHSRRKTYPTFSILYGQHLSVQEFQDTLNCVLPASQITDSAYRIGVSIFESDELCPRILVIGFFNSSDENHLPIANFRLCTVNGTRNYEYISSKKNVEVTIEEEP